MAKITIKLEDTVAEKQIEKYDNGDLQSGAFIKSTDENSTPETSAYIIDTCDANYEKFAADTLGLWLNPLLVQTKEDSNTVSTDNAALIQLKEVLEKKNDCANILFKASVVHPVFSNALPDPSKARGVPINTIPMEWVKRYFTQMISEKDPLFEYKIDLLDKITEPSGGESLSAKTLEKLIQEAKSEGENKNLFKDIFGKKNAEKSQNDTADNSATFDKIIKHYREETQYTRSMILIKDKPYFVTIFTDPSCQFVSVEFKSSDGSRFEFSTLDTESKLPVTFKGNALGLSVDEIFLILSAIAGHYTCSDLKTFPQKTAFIDTLTAQF